MEKNTLYNQKLKKAVVATLISEQVDFTWGILSGHTEVYFVRIKSELKRKT